MIVQTHKQIFYKGNSAKSIYLGSTFMWPKEMPYEPTPVYPSSNEMFWIYNRTYSPQTIELRKFESESDIRTITVNYSFDKSTWYTQRTGFGENCGKIEIPAFTFVYLKATTSRWGSSYLQNYNNIINTSSEAKFEIGGNIMSLLLGDDYASVTAFTSNNYNYAFKQIFKGWSSMTDASRLNLAVTDLGYSLHVYEYMFMNCTRLKVAPTLKATKLTASCYCGMFFGCASLETAPRLTPTNIPDSGYEQMFANCTSLINAPVISATSVGLRGCGEMFVGCTSLVATPDLSRITSLNENCFWNMFGRCSSLTTVSELPATTLYDRCYYAMFQNCTSLVTAQTILPATTLKTQCYLEMFRGCTSLLNAPQLPATKLINRCYVSMFLGCTSLRTAPELPAPKLEEYAYQSMFSGCTNLNYIKCLATTNDTLTQYYENTNGWVRGVQTNSGTFVVATESIWNAMPSGYWAGVPNNWTIQYA